MKILKGFLISLLVGLALVSCEKTLIIIINQESKVPQNADGEYGIVFGNYSSATRASVSSVSKTGYDDFKLYAWNSSGDTIMKPYFVNAIGISEYNYENITGQELQYFRPSASNYEFIGLLPSNKETNIDNGIVSVKDIKSFTIDDSRVTGTLTEDSPEEFMYSYTKVEKSNYGQKVPLVFNHGNAVIYLGFSSDRSDTKIIDYVPGTQAIPAVPDVNDTTDTWFNLKRSSGNIDGSATKTRVKNGDEWGNFVDDYELPANLVNEIKSYYSVDDSDPGDYDLHLGNTVWPSSTIKKLRIVKPIPNDYKLSCAIYNTDIVIDFFDGFKYLKDNGYDIQPRNSGGKPSVWDYVLIDAFVNGTAYTVVGLNTGAANSIPQYTIVTTPGTPEIPATDPIKGIRVFSADSTDVVYCAHIPHTTMADANISSDTLSYDNRETSNNVIEFSLPNSTTLNTTAVWSPTTFYAIPGDADFNYIVVKLSYIYNNVNVYDVRVPIKLPVGGLQSGKYYKYTIKITSASNGTNDMNEATEEKDDIDITENSAILVNVSFQNYELGDEREIII